ncbi:hypothetical protein D9M69_724880 [compost metagenome]
MAHGLEPVEVPQELPVLLVRLGEADARVDDDLLGQDSGGVQLVPDAAEFGDDVIGNVLVFGQGRHGFRVAAPVGQHVGCLAPGHQLGHAGLDAEA